MQWLMSNPEGDKDKMDLSPLTATCMRQLFSHPPFQVRFESVLAYQLSRVLQDRYSPLLSWLFRNLFRW